MSRDTIVIPFRQPDAIDDPLTEVAREGARRMLAQILIAEADAFVAKWKDLKLPDGRDRVRDNAKQSAVGYQLAEQLQLLASKVRAGPIKADDDTRCDRVTADDK